MNFFAFTGFKMTSVLSLPPAGCLMSHKSPRVADRDDPASFACKAQRNAAEDPGCCKISLRLCATAWQSGSNLTQKEKRKNRLENHGFCRMYNLSIFLYISFGLSFHPSLDKKPSRTQQGSGSSNPWACPRKILRQYTTDGALYIPVVAYWMVCFLC